MRNNKVWQKKYEKIQVKNAVVLSRSGRSSKIKALERIDTN
jgi:hypothetical protein